MIELSIKCRINFPEQMSTYARNIKFWTDSLADLFELSYINADVSINTNSTFLPVIQSKISKLRPFFIEKDCYRHKSTFDRKIKIN